MKTFQYNTKKTCSSALSFALEDGKLHNVKFAGGCEGNLKAISKLVEGMSAEQVIQLLKGNTCGYKTTSCADQLATAVELALQES